jgi:hypothetical protein
MDYLGKYVFTMPTPSGERESIFFLRNYYDGSLHGTLLDSHGGVAVASDIKTETGGLSFTAQAGPAKIRFSFDISTGSVFSGTATVEQSDGESIRSEIKGEKTEITPKDDGVDRIEMKRKALILYATITKNTEKVAEWFKETFRHYGIET